ncbi:MAG: chromate transporter, partial [Clostridia bacterium]|nr:chromate transporter [Clostridia bacterium]
NMATFIGSSQGGALGAVLATLGVILPAFLIILLIAAILRNLLKYKGVQGFLSGVRPAVAALILATALVMGLRSIFGLGSVYDAFDFNYKGLIILAVLVAIGLGSKYLLKRKASPIVMILLSAGLGILLYGVF